MTTHELLASRWSPSIFDPSHELSRADLELLLDAARWAPSGGNLQPWSFLVTRRGDPGHRHLVAALSRGNAGWVPDASAVLIAISDPSGKLGGYADYAVGQAVAHLTIQARAMDLHTHQFAGFDHDRVAMAFAVPDPLRVLVGVAIGRHGDPAAVDERLREREQRTRTRKPRHEVAFAGRWGDPW